MKTGYYPINICSVTAPTLLSFLISILPESSRLAGHYSTKSAEWQTVLTARYQSGQSYAEEKCKLTVRLQIAARCPSRPSRQSQMLPVMQELCWEPAKKVYTLSAFHYLTPPIQLLVALLLLKSDLARCTCPTAHTTPPGPSLIARNTMYSLNTGWQRGWCGDTLALGQLGEGRQERA